MKNRNRKIKILILAVLLIILIQCIGITYAKYIASEKAVGQAEVAKWAFQIKKDGETTKTINLGSTINNKILVNGKIAPGTSGEFVITLDATGAEVDMNYSIQFTNEQNKPKNLVFSYQGKKYTKLSELNEIVGRIGYSEVARTRGIPITWEWSYETGTTQSEIATNDKIDTENSKSITEYTFDILVTATQGR